MDGGADSVSRHPSPLVLVRMSGILELGSRITIRVGLTGKFAAARVVLVSRERPFEYGIALDERKYLGDFSASGRLAGLTAR